MPSAENSVAPRSGWVYGGLAVAVMATGLLWRSRFLPLPAFAAKYGGDALWALMVFFLLGILLRRQSTPRLALWSLLLAWSVEFSQLAHFPILDWVRSTRIGHLILGSTFNWPDLPAYAFGIAIGALLETALRRRTRV